MGAQLWAGLEDHLCGAARLSDHLWTGVAVFVR